MTDSTAICEAANPPAVPIPENEEERVRAVHALEMFGATADPEFTELTALAAHICEVPIALITLVDEENQWFSGKFGIGDLCGTPRDVAFCAHAIMQSDLFVVPDAFLDERFARNPLVTSPPNIRFYAGMPLVDAAGCSLGTLCVIDRTPRRLTPKQELGLRVLSRHVMALLELRRSNRIRRQAEESLKQAYGRLERRVTERTEELHSARERLQLAIGASNIGLWEWDIRADRLYHSPESCAQIGLKPSEMPQNWDEWTPRMHPDDLEMARRAFGEYLADPSADYSNESRVRHKDGTYRWILTRARMFQDAHGHPDRMYGSTIDITERRLIEERLRESREQLRALAAHLRTAREEETSRVARELHDELGSTLTGMKLDVGWIERQLKRLPEGEVASAIRERLRSVSEQIDKTIGGVRKVCRDLRPAVLDELGLAAALDWLGGELETRTGMPCRVTRPETIAIDPAQAIVIFRITQELLTNVARHAQASQAKVELRRLVAEWELEVTDNGRGLPADALTRRDRFGLVGLRERVLAAGGRVDFLTPAEGGTRVTVVLPILEPLPV